MKQKLLSILLVLFGLNISAYAQEILFQGHVIADDDGRPLSGVTVSILGTNTATQTNSSGKFSISASKNNTLIFSYINFKSKEVKLGSQSNLTVRLLSLDQSLDEVVVTGYSVLTKKEFTGASQRVGGEKLAQRPLQSFSQGLTGQAAGVNIVQATGLLNNPPVIRVRGLSSISLSSFPLVVIDGIPVSTNDVSENAAANNPLADINPADIESIDILKDAASAALYGSRAAAGVLVVTTKRGKSGSTKLTYNGWVGVTHAVRLPKVLNAQQYMDYKNQAIANARELSPSLPESSYPSKGGFFPMYDDKGNMIETDWYKEVYRSGFSHNHDVTLSGGTEKTQYYFSAGLSEQEGILRANKFSRKSGRFNIAHKATDWLKFNATLAYTNSLNNAPNSGSFTGGAFAYSGLARIAIAQSPNVPAYNEDGSYYLNGAAIGSGNNVLEPTFPNPMPLIDLDKNKSETNRLFSTIGAQLKLLEGLTFNTNFTWDLRNTDNNRFWNPIQGDGIGVMGQAYNNAAKINNWNIINTLNYKKSFDKHHFNILIGNDAQKTKSDNWGAERQNIADDFFTHFQGSFTIDAAAGNDLTLQAFEAYLGSINYNYAGKYFISGNYRRDGNSALSPKHRWGNFGGASVGWTLSEEDFFKNSSLGDIFPTMRLKGSWGRVGNGNLNALYAAYSTYGATIYGGGNAFVFNQAGNDNLKWETSSQKNIGLEFSLPNNRFSAEINWYRKDIDNLILDVPQTPSKGIPDNSILMNVGSMYNRGWEFTLNATPIRKENFQWNSSLNFSINKNEVTALADGVNQLLSYTSTLELTNITKVGSSAAQIYGIQTAGINPENGRRIFVDREGRKVQFQYLGGESTWTLLDGTPVNSISDQAIMLGNTLPKWYGGFNNTFAYKNFDAALNFTFSGGNYIYNGSRAGLRDQRIWNNSTDVLGSWTETNKNGDIPRAIYGDNISNGSAFLIQENVEKGDFLRLQTATLGYKLPTSALGRSGISNLRVFASVNNAFIITKYTGVDPEISSNGNSNIGSGIERNAMPNGRAFTFGVNVTF
ncbi:SusC/RagA family TonB-linked outer membrane protein [Sphingobacterium sp. Mn56C]|uniref:SusC/RagA family TonB-linked outer membrane protein n=1 Tax=Sphingobacterium sp. Mn56C TaxID=3395261 RepID=UPI003BBDDC5A